ncbi:MAG: hypothetical protein ABIQ18_25105 [Umezawaea sp.]
MVSASAQVSIPRMDEKLLVGALAELIRRLRALTFDTDGVLVHDGARIEGLRLLDGRHNRKNARYQLVAVPNKNPEGEESADPPEPAILTILAAGHDSLAFRLELGEMGNVAFAIRNPARPGKITGSLDVAMPEDSGWLLRGPVRVDASVDLTALSSMSPRTDQVVARVKHRRASASAKLAISNPDSREWVVQTLATVRGGGLLRPLVAVVGPFLRNKFAAELQKGMDKMAARIVELDIGTPTASKLADLAFDVFIDGLTKVVEPHE